MRRFLLSLGVLSLALAGCVRSGGVSARQAAVKFKAPGERNAFIAALVEASRPGPMVQRYLAGISGSPAERLVQFHDRLARDWHYEEDPPGADWIASAEDLLRQGLRGDCEDRAIVAAAGLRELNLRFRWVTTKDTPRFPAHLYTEVQIAPRRTSSRQVVDRLVSLWQGAGLPFHEDRVGIWMPLDGGIPPELYGGPIEYIAGGDGEIWK